MIVGVGLDVADTRRMERLLRRFDDSVLGMVFTRRELAAVRHASDPARRLALSFGVKEACGKALGTGLAGIRWTDIEAAEVDGATVRPSITGGAAARAALLGVHCWRAWWSPLGEAGDGTLGTLGGTADNPLDDAEGSPPGGAGRSPLGWTGESPLGGAEGSPPGGTRGNTIGGTEGNPLGGRGERPLDGAGESPLDGAGRNPLGRTGGSPVPLLVVAVAASDPADLPGLYPAHPTRPTRPARPTHPTHQIHPIHGTTTKGSQTWQATSTSRPW